MRRALAPLSVVGMFLVAGCAGLPGFASNPADTGGLTIAGGKKYHYKYKPEVMGFIDIEVLAYTGNTITYNGRTILLGKDAQEDKAKTLTLENGVFWPHSEPTPVTKDISKYAEESVTVGAGTFQCRVVASDGLKKTWFAGPMVVKIANPLASMELVSID